jgi:outer membrane protein
MKKAVAYFILALSTCSLLQADDPPLTWDGVIRETLNKNPNIAAARATLRRAERNIQTQASGFFPTLTGTLSVNRSNVPVSFTSLGQTGGGAINDFENALTATQNVFGGFSDVARVRQARAERDAAVADLQTTFAGVGADLQNAFAGLLYAQDNVALTRGIAERRHSNTRLVHLRYDVGRENLGSLLRTQADEKSSQLDVAAAERALRVAQREMGRVLGRSRYQALSATGTLALPNTAAQPDFEKLAIESPVARRARAEIEIAEQELMLVRSDFSPSLDARASGYRSGAHWPPSNDHWSVGATLTLPFFSGGSTLFGQWKAEEERRRAQFNALSVEQQTVESLEDAWAALQNAVDGLALADQYLEAAEVRAKIARGQYANGLLNYQDWDLIESDLVARQKTRLSSVRDATVANAAWNKAQGLDSGLLENRGL